MRLKSLAKGEGVGKESNGMSKKKKKKEYKGERGRENTLADAGR